MCLKRLTNLKINSKGFTLVELIIIIVLIGIFSVAALTRTNLGLNTIQEKIAIDQITNDIDLARSMAFAKHETITIVFSKNNEGVFNKNYTIYSGEGEDKALILDFPNSENGVVSLDNSKMRSVDIESVDFDDGYELQFIPLGDCALLSDGFIELNSKIITIKPITGNWIISDK